MRYASIHKYRQEEGKLVLGLSQGEPGMNFSAPGTGPLTDPQEKNIEHLPVLGAMLSHPLTGSEPGVLWAPPDLKHLLPEHQTMSCREDMTEPPVTSWPGKACLAAAALRTSVSQCLSK